MTLDDAIKHAEDVAKRCESHVYEFPEQLAYVEKFFDAKKCAEEYRQLAAWLRDYKRLLAIAAGVDVKCGNCRFDGVRGERCFTCYQYSNWEEADSA